MGTLVMIGQLLLALSILIILHEWGHFVTARMFGIRVEKFYLFFDAWGKKLFSFKKGDTEYGIGWLPLGGYVKISGMIDESMDKEQLKQEPQPWEFRTKPAWQRFIVMVGGVTVNLILGLFISAMILWYYGDNFTPVSEAKYGFSFSKEAEDMGFKDGDQIISVNGKPLTYIEKILTPDIFTTNGNFFTVNRDGVEKRIDIPDNLIDILSEKKSKQSLLMPYIKGFSIDSVASNAPAAAAGLQKGDRILKVGETDIIYFNDLKEVLEKHQGKATAFLILRGNDTLKKSINISEDATIGFFPKYDETMKTVHIDYSFGESFPLGISRGWDNLTGQVSAFGKIFTGKVKATNALQGPIGIANAFGRQWDWFRFWNLTALLSLVLAFMNILPIPALDGGHVLLIIVEKLRGRPLSEKAMERVQTVGMVLVLALMVFAFGNDIWKALFR